MSPPDRKEDEVRRLLEGPYPAVPPDLTGRAVQLGHRLRRRRRAVRTAVWALLLAAAMLFAVWAATGHPWTAPPSTTTPPLEGW
jgi:ferric-dicitrate binding protein FerR (iron transport regulator)